MASSTSAERAQAPLTCGQCNCVNHWPRRFCAKCGATVAALCGRCGFSNELSAQFCGGCGGNRRTAKTGAQPPRRRAVPTPRPIAAASRLAKRPPPTPARPTAGSPISARLAALNDKFVRVAQAPDMTEEVTAPDDELGQDAIDAMFNG